MLTARSIRTGVLYTLAGALILVALIALAACDATGGVGGTDATPGRPTATVEAARPRSTRPAATPTLEEFFPEDPTATFGVEEEPTEEPTSTPRRRATATPEEEPTEEPTSTPRRRATATPEEEPTEEPTIEEPTAVAEGDYLLYVAEEGDWSIEYPEDWTLNEDPPNYQWLEPSGEAFIQVTYSEGGGTVSNEELADIASTQFEDSFDNYVESGQFEQNDGSYRIDFKFSAGGIDWDAQAFVEARQGNLYMLMLATTEDAFQDGTYSDVITYVIASYDVPN